MGREEVRARYAELRAISNKHHDAALDFVPREAINRNARALGMMVGRRLAVESNEEMALVRDLCVYHAARERSRALERYMRANRPVEGSSDALMLAAMVRARFSLWQVVRPHEVARTVIFDMLREREAWLMDNGLEMSRQEGMVFAARLTEPEDFALTCGVIAPVDELTLLDVADVEISRRASVEPEEMADDPRFAIAVYRAALHNGMIDTVRFQ